MFYICSMVQYSGPWYQSIILVSNIIFRTKLSLLSIRLLNVLNTFFEAANLNIRKLLVVFVTIYQNQNWSLACNFSDFKCTICLISQSLFFYSAYGETVK